MFFCLLLATSRAALSLRVAKAPKAARPSLLFSSSNRVFDRADSNSDGIVDRQELYELVLKAYVYANRFAILDPPDKASVLAIFDRADYDGDGRLSRQEFASCTAVLGLRLSGRVVAFLTVKFIVSPLLAWEIVRRLSDDQWLIDLGRRAVPQRFHGLVLTKHFWQVALTVAFVSQLGGLVLAAVNKLLAGMPIANRLLRMPTDRAFEAS